MRVRELFISFFDTWFARAIVFTIDTTSAPLVGQFSVGVNILRDLKLWNTFTLPTSPASTS